MKPWEQDSHSQRHRFPWNWVRRTVQWHHRPLALLMSNTQRLVVGIQCPWEPMFGLVWSTMYKIVSVLYLDFQGAPEGHAEVSVIVFVKYSLEGLLEQGSIKRVAHHNMAPGNTNCNQYLLHVQWLNWNKIILDCTNSNNQSLQAGWILVLEYTKNI